MIWKFNGLGHIIFLSVTVLLLIQVAQCKCEVLTKSNNQMINFCYQIYGSQNLIYFTNCTSQKCLNYNINNNCLRMQTHSYDIFQCTQALCPNQDIFFESCVTKLSKKVTIGNSEIIRFVLLVTVLPIGVGIVVVVVSYILCKRYGDRMMKCLVQCLGLDGERNGVGNDNEENYQVTQNTKRKYIDREDKYHKKQRKHMQNAQLSQYIMSLEPVPLSQLNQESCCICLTSQNINSLTSCHHYYHAQCLTQWLQKGSRCPNCQNDKKSFSVMIFCVGCGKIRDCFKFFKKTYVSISKVDVGFFMKWPCCNNCAKKVTQKVVDQSTAAVWISQSDSIGWNSREPHSKLIQKANQ